MKFREFGEFIESRSSGFRIRRLESLQKAGQMTGNREEETRAEDRSRVENRKKEANAEIICRNRRREQVTGDREKERDRKESSE